MASEKYIAYLPFDFSFQFQSIEASSEDEAVESSPPLDSPRSDSEPALPQPAVKSREMEILEEVFNQMIFLFVVHLLSL